MALKRVNTVNSSNISSLFPETTPSIASVAVSTGKAYILIGGVSTVTVTGTGFVSGSTVYVDSAVATVTTYVSSTSLTATLPTMLAGSYAIYVKNPDGTTGVLVNAVTYTSGPAWVTPAGSLGTITLSSPLFATVVATSVSPLTGYTVTAGALPYGNTLNSATGVITGGIVGTWPNAPYYTASTTFNFDITATDTLGLSATRSFFITYASNVSWVTAANLGNLPSGANTTINLVATGSPYFVATSNLPDGFSLNTGTGVITCAVGTYFVDTVFKFSVAAVDRAGWAVLQEFTLIITRTPLFIVDFLVVAGGGGGGGWDNGGGGGAGGYRTGTISITPGSTTYPITVGGGAGGGGGGRGGTGGNSTFSTTTSNGGGGGGSDAQSGSNFSAGATQSGGPGGSGGGGWYGGSSGGAGTVGQGNNGGTCFGSGASYPYSGGGGGGAGAAGANGGGGIGIGGDGLPSSITGTPTFYAGGGGGARNGGSVPGGNGGGGTGGQNGGLAGQPGSLNTGGGGGGGAYPNQTGGGGGSGVVILAYASTNKDLASITAGLVTQSWNGSAWVNNAAGVTTPVTNLQAGVKIYRFASGTGTIQW